MVRLIGLANGVKSYNHQRKLKQVYVSKWSVNEMGNLWKGTFDRDTVKHQFIRI